MLRTLDGPELHAKTSEYDKEMPQSQTTDQPMAPREESKKEGKVQEWIQSSTTPDPG